LNTIILLLGGGTFEVRLYLSRICAFSRLLNRHFISDNHLFALFFMIRGGLLNHFPGT